MKFELPTKQIEVCGQTLTIRALSAEVLFEATKNKTDFGEAKAILEHGLIHEQERKAVKGAPLSVLKAVVDEVIDFSTPDSMKEELKN